MKIKIIQEQSKQQETQNKIEKKTSTTYNNDNPWFSKKNQENQK